MKRYLLIVAACVGFLAATAQNYIVEVSPLEPVSTVSFNGEEPTCAVNHTTTIQYFDGFGDLRSTVAVGITPEGNNLVTNIERNGHVERAWLPVPTEERQVSSETAQSAYSDSYPYTETRYEYPSSDRPIKSQSPGNSWQGHAARSSYSGNPDNSVLNFTVTTDGLLYCQGYYFAGMLQMTTTTDEDGKQKVSYVNKQGQVVLTKEGTASTYYVYDQLDRLRFVLPPKLSAAVSIGSTYSLYSTLLFQYAYCYQYDERGNLIYKRLPGNEPIHMVYDKTNRLVLRQDGNLRNKDGGAGCWWEVFKYDLYGRPAYSCIVNTRENNWEGKLDSFKNSVIKETFSTETSSYPMGDTGYSRVFYHTHTTYLHHVWYYDDYGFLEWLPESSRQGLSCSMINREESAIGRLTGERIYNLEGNGYITVAHYYDIKGNEISTQSTNHLGGINIITTEYNFANQPVNVVYQRSTNFSSAVREQYQYTYDAAGRLSGTYYWYGNSSQLLLSHNYYDEFGRLSSQSIHNNAGLAHFLYDIHGNMTHNHKFGFAEKLYYNTPNPYVPGNTPCYNGNVSSALWSAEDMPYIPNSYGEPEPRNGYHYTYDNMNRLQEADAIIDQVLESGQTKMERFVYDANGNITSLTRDNFDDLNFVYFGNRLISVEDDGDDANLNSVKEFHTQNGEAMYTYDANGNLISDSGRGITSITYNILNLPQLITFSNGNQIHHYYDAAGTRYQTTYITRQGAATLASHQVMEQSAEQNASAALYYTYIYYNDNLEYTQTGGGAKVLSRVHNPEGYITPSTTNAQLAGSHYYYAKDHLGNIRETYQVTYTGGVYPYQVQTKQQVQYYPSGLPWAATYFSGANLQPYKYGGKEFVEMHGLDEYDSEARWYYPAIMRTTTMDPLCEKYYSTSPYAWCGNNPVNLVDQDGRDCKVALVDGVYVVSAVYYCGESSKESALKAVNWWNNQEATYTDGDKTYPVKFELSVKVFSEQSKAHNALLIDNNSNANEYSVDNISQETIQAAGKTGHKSKVTVTPNSANNELVGAHEIGHTLITKQGGHTSSGVMAPTTSKQTNSLEQETVDAIINDNKPWYERILEFFY